MELFLSLSLILIYFISYFPIVYKMDNEIGLHSVRKYIYYHVAYIGVWSSIAGVKTSYYFIPTIAILSIVSSLGMFSLYAIMHNIKLHKYEINYIILSIISAVALSIIWLNKFDIDIKSVVTTILITYAISFTLFKYRKDKSSPFSVVREFLIVNVTVMNILFLMDMLLIWSQK